jgi:hypothetical protein
MAKDGDGAVPTEFFTIKTFSTLGGSVLAAGVIATVISAVFHLDPKIVGLIVSVGVAYVGVFLAKRRKLADLVVAGFNGFLIYFTLIGATSFYPYLNNQTAADIVSGATNAPTSPFRPWVHDRNLVKASRSLVEINKEQAKTLSNLQSNGTTLEKRVQGLDLSPAARSEISSGLATNRHLILMTHTNIAWPMTTLRTLGVHQ